MLKNADYNPFLAIAQIARRVIATGDFTLLESLNFSLTPMLRLLISKDNGLYTMYSKAQK